MAPLNAQRSDAVDGQLATSGDGSPVTSLVIDEIAALRPHLHAWDALAVAAGLPFCAPSWMLAWWQNARTGDARLRVILVLDGEELIGVGPFFAQVKPLGLVEMRLLGAGFSHRIAPLAGDGRKQIVAAALARSLAALDPAPVSVVFEGVEMEDDWPDLIAASWPSRRRPRQRLDASMDAPVIQLDASFTTWMDRRERRFRKEARRVGRRLDERGVRSRVACDRSSVQTLMALHHARWQNRGGSHAGDDAESVILAAAAELGDAGRLAVALLEEKKAVAAELVLLAGESAVFWGGGFDPDWASSAPGTQAMLFALQVLAERGVRIADLGGGAHPYKLRMADENRPLAWRTIFPRGRRYLLIRARLGPKHLRHAVRQAARRLPPGLYERIRRLRKIWR